MPSVVICAAEDGTGDLARTILWRDDVTRTFAASRAEALRLGVSVRPDLVVIDGAFAEAEPLVRDLRVAPETRAVSIVILAPGELRFSELGLLQAGANTILRRPQGPDWDERLSALMAVPPRLAGRFAIQLRFDASVDGLGPEAAAGTVLNLSEHGVLLESDLPIPIGASLDFKIHLDDATRPLRGSGRIVRQEGERRRGIQFFALEPEGRARIRRYIRSRSA